MKRAAGEISKTWAPTVLRLILLSEMFITFPRRMACTQAEYFVL